MPGPHLPTGIARHTGRLNLELVLGFVFLSVIGTVTFKLRERTRSDLRRPLRISFYLALGFWLLMALDAFAR